MTAWLLGTAAMVPGVRANAQLLGGHRIDDGSMDIVPAYDLQYDKGDAVAHARAVFQLADRDLTVGLAAEGAISVNEHALRSQSVAAGIRYVGTVPFGSSGFTFKWIRGQGKTMPYTFRLPEFDPIEFPKTYRAPEPLKVRLREPVIPAGAGVVQEFSGLAIQTSMIRLDFMLKASEEGGTVLVYEPILKRPQPPGKCSAQLARQFRYGLGTMPGVLTKGWCRCNYFVNFDIDVLG